MPVRPEVITELQREAHHGGIFMQPGEGKKAQTNLGKATELFTRARRNLLEQEYAKNFRVWILGGSRFDKESPEYKFVSSLSSTLVSQLGVDIITGGGPGIMQAAVEGFDEAKKRGEGTHSRKFGIGLDLPWEEERPSSDYYTMHAELLPRVQELVDFSHAAYVGPGAVGTAFELWTLIQLKQMNQLEESYALIVHPSWKEELEAERKKWYEDMLARGEKPIMGKDDLTITYSDNITEIVGIIGKSFNKWNEDFGRHVRRPL